MSIDQISLVESLKESFSEYAKEVILERAIPDGRDGLKPVHRRILFDMFDTGLVNSKPHKKSAKVVGDVLGRFHPHGDSSVYDAMVRLGQEFSTRYPLIDKQGNFGGIDGSSKGAYRYTEARLALVGEALLEDTKAGFVDFTKTFDESEEEPTILGGWFPNLLCNGTSGIAIGMSTNIPSHNFNELADALIYFMKNPSCAYEELLLRMPAPDFATGGTISGDFLSMYKKGYGSFSIQSKYRIEKGKKIDRIIFIEIPYGKRTDDLIEQIDKVLREHPDVLAIRDESDENVRLVIECKKNSFDDLIVLLFAKTDLKVSFHSNFLVVYDKKPVVASLKKLFAYYARHQLSVLTRKLIWEISKLDSEIHLLEGWEIISKNIPEVVRTLMESDDRHSAIINLQQHFSLTESQAISVVDTRLSRLTKVKVEETTLLLDEKRSLRNMKNDILNEKDQQINVICQRLEEGKVKFGDSRRSELV